MERWPFCREHAAPYSAAASLTPSPCGAEILGLLKQRILKGGAAAMGTWLGARPMGEQTVTAGLRAITELALKVFEDEEAATDWLRRPNPALDGARPIQIAETAEGEERVKIVLGRIESGVYS